MLTEISDVTNCNYSNPPSTAGKRVSTEKTYQNKQEKRLDN